MKKRLLGNSKLMISSVGLGVMPLSSGFYNDQHSDQETATQLIHSALDKGVNFFDTADFYGQGHNETVLGKALKGIRDQAVVATKFGFKTTDDPLGIGIDGRPEYIKNACEASLKRLGMDYIDLYYQHRVDSTVPIEESVGAMSELVRAGYVRTIGLCETSAETLGRACQIHPVSALQSEYSVWSRDVEQEVLPKCLELGVTFVAYSPLGRGFLTEKASSLNRLSEKDYRRSQPRFQGDNFARNLEIVDSFARLAEEKKCTVAQLALAWVLAREKGVVPIPGTRKERHLYSNIEAAEITLSPSEISRIDKLATEVAGERYGKLGMSWTNM